jgi:hypothetical protein
MGTEAKVEVRVGLSRREWLYFVIGVILVNAAVQTLTMFISQPWASGFTLGPGGGVCAIPLPFVAGAILLLLRDAGFLKQLDTRSIFIIYMAVMLGSIYSVYKGMYQIISPLYNVRIGTAAVHGYAVPLWWIPSEAAIRGMFYRGSLGNLARYWNEWAPVIATWAFYYGIVSMMFLGWMSILRRLWVEVEMLPVPWAQSIYVADLALTPQPTRSKKIFKIAFLIGILIYIPYMLYFAYPGLPDFYGWVTAPGFFGSAVGTFDLVYYPFIRNTIAAPLSYAQDPLRYAILFLAPLDTIFSLMIGVLIYILLPQICAYMGYYTGIFTQGSGTKAFWIDWDISRGPLGLGLVAFGMWLGIFVFMFVFNWRYFADAVKATMRPRSVGDVSYKLAWALFIIGFIGWTLLMYASTGFTFLDHVLYMFLIIMLVTTMVAYAWSYTGLIWRTKAHPYWKPFAGDTIPPAPQVPAGKFWCIAHTARWGTGEDTYGPYYSAACATVLAYTWGRHARIDPDTVMKMLLIGFILSSIILPPLVVVECHAWGFMEIPATKEWDFTWTGDAGSYNPYPSIASVHGLIGFILAGVLLYLRRRYPWWPIDPVGIALVPNNYSLRAYIAYLTVPVVWVAKYLLLKIGGRKAYEEYGLPAAAGIIAGETTGLTIAVTILAIRFLIFGVR